MDFFTDSRFKASRMYNDYDLENFAKYKYFAKYRPRGVLSGLLVIKDKTSPIEFIQQNKPKISLKFRFDESLTEKGPLIFYTYLTNGSVDKSTQTLIIEDLFLFENVNYYQTKNFDDRWKTIQRIFTNPKLFVQDTILSNNMKIECANYYSLAELKKPEENIVLEMIPNNKNMKRVIVLLEKEDNSIIMLAEKIIGKGPDLFFLKDETKDEYLEKIAGIQSLEISKALRNTTTAKVKCIYNEKFEKFVIVEVLSLASMSS